MPLTCAVTIDLQNRWWKSEGARSTARHAWKAVGPRPRADGIDLFANAKSSPLSDNRCEPFRRLSECTHCTGCKDASSSGPAGPAGRWLLGGGPIFLNFGNFVREAAVFESDEGIGEGEWGYSGRRERGTGDGATAGGGTGDGRWLDGRIGIDRRQEAEQARIENGAGGGLATVSLRLS